MPADAARPGPPFASGYPPDVFERDLELAHDLADAADQVTLRWFRSTELLADAKGDRTFVTQADTEAERVLRQLLASARPHDGILGEELGQDDTGPSGRRWILDPVDGTHGFMRGAPIFATLLALEADGELVLGMASAPALGHRWWATRGGGAFVDGAPIHVSHVDRMDEAQLSYTSVRSFEPRGLGDRVVALERRFWRVNGFGDFWQHVLVAEGAADVALDPVASLWDLAAVQVVVEEAGGRFTDFDGTARPDGGGGISSNGLLHDEVLAALRP